MSAPHVLTIEPSLTLGSIATGIPGASAIFRKHRLDYCCGGAQTLQQATDSKGIDCAGVIAELSALQRTEALTVPADTRQLIGHILTRYHEVHRAQLTELIRLARKVESVHGARPDAPAGLGQLLSEMEAQLLAHMAKEEQVLFPLMTSGREAVVSQPIRMMRLEHTEHGTHLAELEKLTNGFTPPADACTTWRVLYNGLRQFRDDLMEHIHLENNVLFPRFDA